MSTPALLRRAAVPGLLCITACSPFGPEMEEVADPAAEIGLAVQAASIPSLAAWVVSDGAIVWEGHYGLADVAEQRPTDASTFYGVASVSKLVVVTAVMQLAEQGLLDLDADVGTYLPFPLRHPGYPDTPITAHHLLTHTSGLNWPESESEVPGFYDQFNMDSAPALATWIPQLLLPTGVNYVPAVWMPTRPGKREYYSNIGVAVLAYLVERVSGTEFNAYCREHIFEPLDMRSTSFAYADLDMSRAATPYAGNRRVLPFARGRAYPAGDLKTTPEDFSRFVIAYMNSGSYRGARILQAATVEEILRTRNPASGVGLIWFRSVGDWYGHAGGKDGVSAYVEFQPDSNVALMIVTNQNHAWVYPGNRIHALVRRIARLYLGG